jgi:hypothetical protein
MPFFGYYYFGYFLLACCVGWKKEKGKNFGRERKKEYIFVGWHVCTLMEKMRR